MVKIATNHAGKRFGMWTVLTRAPNKTGHRTAWNCRCDCGKEKPVSSCHLVAGKSTNCGCMKPVICGAVHTKHGMTDTRLHQIWCGIKARCTNPKNKSYHRYGGRGIKMCAEWDASFEAFMRDIGPRPSPSHSIDRVDGDGNYEPGNCRWATPKEQARNTVRNRFHIVNGERMTIEEAIERFGSGQRPGTIRGRVKDGQTAEQALGLI